MEACSAETPIWMIDENRGICASTYNFTRGPPRPYTYFVHIHTHKGGCALGSAVILGRIWFTEVDTDGSILSRTGISPKFAPPFVRAGQHQVSYSVDKCYPSDSGHDLWASRFAPCGHISLP